MRFRPWLWIDGLALGLAQGPASAAEDLSPYTKDPIFLRWAAESKIEGTKLLPPLDGKWHVIERTDEKSTSACLRHPVTPLCAVEIYNTCELRQENDLCAIAWNDPKAVWPFMRTESSKLYWQIRIVMARRLRTKDVLDWNAYHKEKARWRTGEVAIGYVTQVCYDPFEGEKSRPCEAPELTTHLAILRRAGAIWYIVDIQSPLSRTREFD